MALVLLEDERLEFVLPVGADPSPDVAAVTRETNPITMLEGAIAHTPEASAGAEGATAAAVPNIPCCREAR